MKKIYDPPSFFMAPPYSEENDSPLTGVGDLDQMLT